MTKQERKTFEAMRKALHQTILCGNLYGPMPKAKKTLSMVEAALALADRVAGENAAATPYDEGCTVCGEAACQGHGGKDGAA